MEERCGAGKHPFVVSIGPGVLRTGESARRNALRLLRPTCWATSEDDVAMSAAAMLRVHRALRGQRSLAVSPQDAASRRRTASFA